MNKPLKWLYNCLHHKHRIVLLIILQSVLSVFSIGYAFLFKEVADAAIVGSLNRIYLVFFYFVLIVFAQGIFTAVFRRLQEVTKNDFNGTLKERLLSKIFFNDFDYTSSIHSGDWMNKITSDIGIVSNNAVSLLPNVFGILFHFLLSLVLLYYLQPRFVLFLIIVLAMVLCLEFHFYKNMRILHKEVQKKDGNLRSFILECLNSLTMIKSYSKEEHFLVQMNNGFEEFRKANLQMNMFSTIMNFFFGTGMNAMLVLSGIFCAVEIVKGSMTYGTFVAVIQITTQLRSPLANAYINIPNYYSMIGSIERLMEIEEVREDNLEIKKDINNFYRNELQSVRLSDICFSYKDERNKTHVIDNLSLEIRKGSFVGISGPSGCGKSTLFKILLNLYRPDSGKMELILADKTSISLDSSFRSLFAYVPQDKQLMRGTIKDVVCFGNEYDMDRMGEALKISCCTEFIDKMKEGVETHLDENGSGLSEGQMQRLAIARAIYSLHPILLLDEATSSLNEKLELNVLTNIKKMTDRTVVLITHKKTSLDFSDIIIRCQEEKNGEYRWLISETQ